MISARIISAFAVAMAASLAAAADAPTKASKQFTTPTVTLPARAMEDIGCFKTPEPLIDYGEYQFQSPGNCQLVCIMLDKAVMGIVNGTNCFCGDYIPRKNAKVDKGDCKTPCGGDDTVLCGGKNKWFISLTGTERNEVEYYDEIAPEESSSTSQTSASQETKPPSDTNDEPITITQTAAPEEKKGPNKAGIAAGVVVGVVVLAAIVIGVLLFLRQKRRREVEEEYRRNAAVNSFVSGGKLHTSNSSMTDSRLDPEFMNRRQSNGSIADNEDYSRRILKVTNA